jgi:hypothetical protein
LGAWSAAMRLLSEHRILVVMICVPAVHLAVATVAMRQNFNLSSSKGLLLAASNVALPLYPASDSFASRFPCLVLVLPPKALTGCFLPCLFGFSTWRGRRCLHTVKSYMVSLCLALLCLRILLYLAPFCTPGLVGGVVILPSMSQLEQYHHHHLL